MILSSSSTLLTIPFFKRYLYRSSSSLAASSVKISDKSLLTVNINLDSAWSKVGGTTINSNVWNTSLPRSCPVNSYSGSIADYLGC